MINNLQEQNVFLAHHKIQNLRNISTFVVFTKVNMAENKGYKIDEWWKF